MRKLIDLPDDVVDNLRRRAFGKKISTKKYMENVLKKHANVDGVVRVHFMGEVMEMKPAKTKSK